MVTETHINVHVHEITIFCTLKVNLVYIKNKFNVHVSEVRIALARQLVRGAADRRAGG